ncbi:MAG: RodZ domain-containing protein [Pseudomonadota bacterium]
MVKSLHQEADPYLPLSDHEAPDEVLGVPGDSVAHQLRWARESHGQDLARIAQALRIRYIYLEAIEAGRYDLLPGPAYAVGFIRSYAEFLGLNSREIVSRFKREVEGLDSETELNFPAPTPQGKIPGGIVFLVCALIAALGYGGWIYMSEREQTQELLTGTIPERLQKIVQGESGTTETVSATKDPAGDAFPADGSTLEALPPDPREILADEPLSITTSATAESLEAPPAPDQASLEVESAAGDISPDNTVPEGAVAEDSTLVSPITPDNHSGSDFMGSGEVSDVTASEEASAPEPVSETGVSTTGSEEQNLIEAPVLADDQEPVENLNAGDGILLQTGEITTATDDFEAVFASIPAAPDAGLEPEKRLEPRIYGETNTDSRIVLRALQDSWVQVRDPNGVLLLTRVLRVGDSYRVPDQADLTLLTGNAGGLQIEVDGVPLPPLGAIGTVRRDISLNPGQLLEQEG